MSRVWSLGSSVWAYASLRCSSGDEVPAEVLGWKRKLCKGVRRVEGELKEGAGAETKREGKERGKECESKSKRNSGEGFSKSFQPLIFIRTFFKRRNTLPCFT